MQLNSIHLKNYRRYRNQLVDLPVGIIGIVGRNGSGKSTLIEAIGWCLYGSDAARTKNNEIRTTGVGDEDCSVTLEFTLDSDAVRVVRKLVGNSSSAQASVFLNGDARAHVSGAREVSDYIARRTGMDRVAFFASVFAQQKELNAFSELQPGERKKTITRLLRIDTVDWALDAIRKDIREGENKVRLLREEQKDIDGLRAKQKENAAELSKMQVELKKYERKITGMKKKADKSKEDLDAHNKRHDEYNEIDKKIGIIKTNARNKELEKKNIESDQKKAQTAGEKLRDMQPRLAEFESVRHQKEKLDTARALFVEKKGLKKQHVEKTKKIKDISRSNEKDKRRISRMNDLESKRQKQEATLSEKRTSVDDIKEQIASYSAGIRNDERQKAESEAKLDIINKQGQDGTCPTCERPLRDYYQNVSGRLADTIAKLKKDIQAGKKERENLELHRQSAEDRVKKEAEKLKYTEAEISKIAGLQEKLADNEKAQGSLEREAAELAERLDGLSALEYSQARYNAVKARYDRLESIKNKSIELDTIASRMPGLEMRHADCTKGIAELKEELEREKESLKRVGYDRAEHKKAERAKEKAGKDLENARVKSAGLKEKANTMKYKLEQISGNISEEEKRQERIKHEEAGIESRSRLEHVMGSFKQDLMSRIRPMLSQRASELLGEITQGRYSKIELDRDYNMQVEDEGESFATNRFSGGEEDLANLCLRIAISQELAERSGGMQANFIALDEIFGSQDEERKRSVLDALQALSGRFRQILVITHVEDVKETLPYVLSVREGSENAATITVEGTTAPTR